MKYSDNNNNRNTVFMGIIAFFIFVLIGRLFFLQIMSSFVYQAIALENSIKSNILTASRGQIYDKEGKILAQNVTGYRLIHKYTRIYSKEDVEIIKNLVVLSESEITDELKQLNLKKNRLEKLKEVIEDIRFIKDLTDYSYDNIITQFYKEKPQGYDKTIIVIDNLDKNIALKAVEKIQVNSRIDIVEYNKRYYPQDKLASHVIGYVKSINEKEYETLKNEGYLKTGVIGKQGIEKEYDKKMKGTDGSEAVEVDANQNVVAKLKEIDSIAGENIYLSIDFELQKYMTEQFEGKVGVFIAMEAKTGKIITFVSNPEASLNLLGSRMTDEEWNALANSPERPLSNKGIAGLYPPGSTFKVVTGMGILEGGIPPSKEVYSTGAYKFGRVTFKDSHLSGHGKTNFAKSIEESVNTYYYILSQEVGVDTIVKNAKEFGVGELTGIDIPGESKGVLPSPEWKEAQTNKQTNKKERWLPGDLINMSIGQGYVLMTPIQVAMVYQGIANNGIVMKPTFVDRFVTYDGKVIEKTPIQAKKLNFSAQNLQLVKDALQLPVSGRGGTAKILYFSDYPVSGKTGTAQNSNYKNHHSWLAGFFPSHEPEIVFVSLVEGGGYGSVASGSLVKAFIIKYREKYEQNKRIYPENASEQKTKKPKDKEPQENIDSQNAISNRDMFKISSK